jgi:hypothetical protein
LPQPIDFHQDGAGRFVKVNQLFLENHGLESDLQAIGRTDRDFHPPLMAEAYMEEDRRVIRNLRGPR